MWNWQTMITKKGEKESAKLGNLRIEMIPNIFEELHR